MSEHFDLVVIGAGMAGVAATSRARHRQLQATLTDDAHRRWHLPEALQWLPREQASDLHEPSKAFNVLES